MMSNAIFGTQSSFGMMGITIMPRINYCTELVDSIIEEVKVLTIKTKIENQKLLRNGLSGKLDLERTLYFTEEGLSQIKSRLDAISHITTIQDVLPTTIPFVRAITSELHDKFPELNPRLQELSIVIGSIIMDSASITEARINFKEFNSDSGRLLDEAKLMADSKINKLYPNLDSTKAGYV